MGSEVEVVDDIRVVEIDRCGLVREVDGVLERQVPDGEGLKLRVTGLHTAPDLVIDLAHRGSKLAGAGAGGGDNDKVARGGRELVAAETLVRDDEVEVRRVARDDAVARDRKPQALKAIDERLRHLVALFELRHDDVLDKEAAAAEDVDEAQNVVLVQDAQIRTDLLALDVLGVNADEDLDVVLDALQHRNLVVRGETGQDAGSVHIVEEFAAHLQVELAANLFAAGVDVFGLELDVFLAVKADSVRHVVVPSGALEGSIKHRVAAGLGRLTFRTKSLHGYGFPF